MDAQNPIVQALLLALAGEAVALAGIGLKRGSAWLKRKARIDNDEQLSAVVDRLESVAEKVVTALMQEKVMDIKYANNGRIPPAIASEIKADAIKRIIAELPKSTLEFMDDQQIDRHVAAGGAVERAVLGRKPCTK